MTIHSYTSVRYAVEIDVTNVNTPLVAVFPEDVTFPALIPARVVVRPIVKHQVADLTMTHKFADIYPTGIWSLRTFQPRSLRPSYAFRCLVVLFHR